MAPEIFVSEFIKAWRHAAALSINLHSSVSRLNVISSVYCGACGQNFIVTPDGNITSCLEVLRKTDNRSSNFMYGNYCPQKRRFIINKNRLKSLALRNIHNMPYCSECAIKWHCAGDCPAKSMARINLFNPTQTNRCKIIQAISAEQLLAIIHEPRLGKLMGLKVLDIL